MGRYVIRRLLQLVPVFFGATFLLFFMQFALPGDPIRALGGERPLAESVYNALVERYNLNDPLPIQYGKYLLALTQGDLGESFRGRAVSSILADAFPVTLRLTVVAFLAEMILGTAAGVIAALRRNSFLDSLVLVTTTAIISIPVFVLGFVAQLVVGVEFGWLPVAGVRQGWVSYLMPGFVLGALSLAYVARLTRTSLAENLRADYVRTATAKGLTRRRVVGRHALRNSLIPVVTFLGFDIGTLMTGAIITEGIFNIPGIGGELFEAIRQQEGFVVVGISTVLVIVYVLANLVVDLLYAVLDPRIRYD